ncbi:SDR family NAD(P)-dependent oxidoreductase [Colwellia sp. 6M3]|jgi:short-subunit dehydrogenase|uniref:SDR family NAD(P)-dependent oxidoreductase n=1 Tax=Colwellia sp. 6M3 TaxID=2759849 RepID=UPI0015F63444|nr:SDR family NAD(P)-dependent oxidoreductase [Colwellia sp. 6M3]MBA6415032.1 SDR family NAD(P)-dependent oxidoreductase [Colwellia sp. 6M3]|tara:strand:- start:1552 stop:2382 length:831 start_codon:yes stop_codon:yes gene_type:complete
MNSDFNNKTVIITGASAGVGAATARTFANLGANLVLVARGQVALDKITEELASITSVINIAMDINDASANESLLIKAEQAFGTVDVLINNAGFHQRGEVALNQANDLTKMVDINLRAPIQLSCLMLPYLQKAGGGAIVNVGSLAGRTPLQGAATYAATKAGLRAFTYSLADELQNTGIYVGLVSPGPIDTGFIMSEIDQVEDIVFSQPMSSAQQVADAIVSVARGEKTEISLPIVSGWLTTVSYLFPKLRRALRPALYRKGRKMKEQYKQHNTKSS